MARWAPCVALAGALACGRIGYDSAGLSARDAGAPDAGGADAGTVDAGAPDADVNDADVNDAGDDAGADGGPDCVADPCVLLLPQCGCRDGEMCQRTGATTEERGCVPAGDAPADGACGADVECAPGHACMLLPGAAGRCHAYCDDDADCAPGIQCASYDEGVGIGTCGSACTLEGGCPAGDGCKVVLVYDFDSAGPVVLPLCADPAGAAAGGACGSSIDCAAGLYCDTDTCRPMCRMDGSLPCASGTCQPDLAPIRLGDVEHGVCR